jgi:hypothetical protein
MMRGGHRVAISSIGNEYVVVMGKDIIGDKNDD